MACHSREQSLRAVVSLSPSYIEGIEGKSKRSVGEPTRPGSDCSVVTACPIFFHPKTLRVLVSY